MKLIFSQVCCAVYKISWRSFEEAESNADPKAEIHNMQSCFQVLGETQVLFDSVPCGPSLLMFQKIKWALSKHAYVNELLVEIERHKATMIMATSAQQV
jgi:hypothetical protein